MLISSHFIGFTPVSLRCSPGQGSAATLTLLADGCPITQGPTTEQPPPCRSHPSKHRPADFFNVSDSLCRQSEGAKSTLVSHWQGGAPQRVPASPHKASLSPGRGRAWQSPMAQPSSATSHVRDLPQPPQEPSKPGCSSATAAAYCPKHWPCCKAIIEPLSA